MDQIKQELIKRYKYLYENKDIILSMYIEPKIETKKYKEKLKKAKKTLRDAKKLKREDLIYLLNDCISYYKKTLKTPKYYLIDKIDEHSIKLFEEFLFTDDDIENTTLFKMIEYLKCDEKYLQESVYKINKVQERRSNNKFLNNKPFITVWRILTYVRDKNKDNKTVLQALDKYYNIDRYISTGINWDSGYILLDSDTINNQDYINIEYEESDLSSDAKSHIYSEIIPKEIENEFEQEDDYYNFEWLNQEEIKKFQSLSIFMNGLNNINMLNELEKQQLYLELKPNHKKQIKKM